jgi:hypothetical protein
MSIETRFEIIEDKPVLHRADAQGERIVRTQKVRDNLTGAVTTVNFWANWDSPSRYTRIV